MTELVRVFPNVTVIEVVSLLRQLETATDQAAGAVEAVFGFALLAGVVGLMIPVVRREEPAGARVLAVR